jgi:N-acetylneuraminate synthase/sialic acid synthase
MGDPDLCEKMIIAAARAGADAVKMQKRDNEAMFTKTALNRPYENEFSYGKTYGEHRAHLDWFGMKEFLRFKAVADKHGILFFATPFEEKSARFLRSLDVPLWKIASCDATNLVLVEKVARYLQPMVISTGGSSLADIDALVAVIDKINPNFALLHCISTYPNTDESLNLLSIGTLRDRYPDKLIGFSSHHPGIEPLVVARTMGASIFEVHFTLNRGFRGTDHGFSMEPRGLETICQDLPRVRVMLGSGEKRALPEEQRGFVAKMGKGIYLNRPLSKGEVITHNDICIKSPAGGLRPHESGEVVGHSLIADCSTGVALERGMVE